MRSTAFSGILIVSLIAATCLLMTPAESQAARPNEHETNYHTCPPDKQTLADCTWNGMRFCPCDGACWTEGVADGNYTVTHSEVCATGTWSITCRELVVGDWVVVACIPG